MKGPSEQTLQWLRDFTQELTDLFGDELYSVTLYGSAASGVEFRPESSDLNVLVILERLGAEELRRIQGVLRRYGRLPLDLVVLSRERLNQIPRCYPLEAWEIGVSRKVLHGADVAAAWTVDLGDLARQLESELVGKALGLRSRYLALGANARVRDLEEVLSGMIAPYRALLRALLRLLGHDPPPQEFLEVITQLEERYGFDLAGFRDAYQVRLGMRRLLREELVRLFEKVLGEAEALAARGLELIAQRERGEAAAGAGAGE